jgi:phenylalanyl-tRNA synthetase beta chain
LARRVLSGGHLPCVDSVVDCVNCVSLNHLLPISCFDLQSLANSLSVRRARKGEVFTTLGEKKKELLGGELVVSDQEKIVCLGYVSSARY